MDLLTIFLYFILPAILTYGVIRGSMLKNGGEINYVFIILLMSISTPLSWAGLVVNVLCASFILNGVGFSLFPARWITAPLKRIDNILCKYCFEDSQTLETPKIEIPKLPESYVPDYKWTDRDIKFSDTRGVIR